MPLEKMLLLKGVIGLDLVYSFVIVLASLLIYYSTKELYELSGHKGIKYFRFAFLFFAFAYAFRFLAQWFLVMMGLPRTLQIHPLAVGVLTLILFTYASTAGIFYLWASVHWKKVNKKKGSLILLHALAVAVTLFSIVTNNLSILITIQFIIAVVLAATTYKTEGHKGISGARLIYALLAVFWMLNVLDLLIPNGLQTLQLLIYLVSVGLFILMLYKVVRKTGG